jgi:glyoxylase-like metal-dependent hydrolase (beta-lactamase superfamily II)
LAVFLPDQRILFTGDSDGHHTARASGAPGKGWNLDGFVQSYRVLIGLGSETIVTGHGVLVTNADLQKRMMETQTKRDQVKALVAQGKSLDEVKVALGDPQTVAGPGGGRGIAPLSEIMFRELSK